MEPCKTTNTPNAITGISNDQDFNKTFQFDIFINNVKK